MAPREMVICIGCPLGCRVTVLRDRKGKVTGMKGAECKQGERYVLKELENPVRTLTATVRTGDDGFPLLPVRTSRPVLKELLEPIMKETVKAEVIPPVRAGDIIVKNVFKSKADLIATTDWPGPGGEV
jgi:CxxC motif-containing protein